MEMAMVTANCLYRVPVMPPRKATGMNTEQSTSTMAISAPVRSFIAFLAASIEFMPKVAILCSTFSTTIMASSTTSPMARIMPNKVSMLVEKPSSLMPM